MVFIVATEVSAKRIKMMTSSSTPPYVFSETSSGMVVDIIKEAFKQKGYDVDFAYAPNRRVMTSVEDGSVDGAFNAPGAKGVHFSDSVIVYEDTAFSLAERKLDIKKIEDLNKLLVVAFQNATNFLGEIYAGMAQSNPNYSEITNQASQVPMLFLGRADVIVLEKGIFLYYLNHPKKEYKDIDFKKKYLAHKLFKPFPQFAAFKDKKLRDAFNEGLAKIKDSGKYDKIIFKYTK